MTVWVVNSNKDDTSKALQWGGIRHINMKYVYGDEIENERIPKHAYNRLLVAANRFNFRDDYVLIVGDHLQLVAFVRMLGGISGGLPVHVLRYDKQAEGYIPVWV